MRFDIEHLIQAVKVLKAKGVDRERAYDYLVENDKPTKDEIEMIVNAIDEVYTKSGENEDSKWYDGEER